MAEELEKSDLLQTAYRQFTCCIVLCNQGMAESDELINDLSSGMRPPRARCASVVWAISF